MKKTVLAALALLEAAALIFSLIGCAGRKPPAKELFNTQYFDYFDTFTTFSAYAKDEQQFQEYEEVFREGLETYHKMFDIYDNYPGLNNIKTINDNAGITPVQVDKEIVDLLVFSQEKYHQTDGMVNVAMGSVLSIWHEYREQGLADPDRAQVPDMPALEKAAGHTDIENLVIDRGKSTVYLSDPAMKLDVGAVAKGYAAQRICEKLREKGLTSALVSIGGNVEAIGVKEGGEPWRVGIQNPDIYSSQSYVHALNLQDLALVTSGTYQRYYEVDGVRYHHIINPDTLMPGQDYQSVTILCPDSGQADALSTAVYNMSLEEGMALVESLEDTEAFWILMDESQVCTSGFEAYVREEASN